MALSQKQTVVVFFFFFFLMLVSFHSMFFLFYLFLLGLASWDAYLPAVHFFSGVLTVQEKELQHSKDLQEITTQG